MHPIPVEVLSFTSGTWVHIFRVLVVRSLPIASVSSVYQGIDLQYKKHEYGQTLVEYAITWSYGPATDLRTYAASDR